MSSEVPAYVYKILPHESVDPSFSLPASPLPTDYTIPLPKLDHDDGFVHLSASTQLATTLELFFKDVTAVTVLKIAVEVIEKRGRLEWLGPDGQASPPPYACAHGWVNPVELRGHEIQGVIEVDRDELSWTTPLKAHEDQGFFK
ncbi:hypothetical protein BCR39DRAFT_517556 [Naematelia encephala]|uniref:DUF952 domain-containing protein n=1 Tax=Naematelia encephala TaxID=71784 RepID=A0A1Y2BHP8_9TREE|nr:hypothetical protein BCR39DRAFT_517556 [Naematelia encephala]